MLLLLYICCLFLKFILANVDLTFVEYAKLPSKYAELLANATNQQGVMLFSTGDIRIGAYNYLVNNVTEINNDTDAYLCQLLTGQYTTDCYIFDTNSDDKPETFNSSIHLLNSDLDPK
ncbi:S. pombe specific UPF0321 family protein 3 [Schizosaccharomyces pombe]|uniref:UPF0321 protein PJ695.01c n=1 Tax=Schizosaccharomyces pombe (strain 972 / ATCC 24843) TaxID=284812 RepID=YI81_SCHPO|nr:uncharacterized protein SPAPJ695.01c [Schizosaccharomyces pombe]Q9URW1.1 RecName: Full=UPF0321 protein PJ695.01c; Flags: Precursor [Schizosaccharomyces pombe 972h-]CAB61210.1 S. pombe specific UPF0321 family protein 3 [Schizosaccharomyces pombe]|eukprot:NP_592789.1 uncharacterized protein SPAPJ695.01c [Schizosaccharomyces pombe]